MIAFLAPLLPYLKGAWPILKRLWQPIALALALLAAWHYHALYGAEKALRASDKSAYVAAQEIARQKAEQAKAAIEADYQAKADQKDKEYANEMDSARAAADRYVVSHRMQPQATQGSAGSTVAASKGVSPEGAVGPGAQADMVAVTPDDVQICTENTMRLQSAHDWAAGLNDPVVAK